jgi:hypothetical protein
MHIACIFSASIVHMPAHMVHLSACPSPASPISSNQLHFYYCNITYASLTAQFLCPLPAPAWPGLPGPLQAVAGCQALQWRAPEEGSRNNGPQANEHATICQLKEVEISTFQTDTFQTQLEFRNAEILTIVGTVWT